MEPVLAAMILRPAVPRDRKRLYAAIGELDQILLQRIDAERVFHLEGRKLAIGAIRFDEEFAFLPEKAGMDAVMVETCIVEIAEHGRSSGALHGMLVLRFLPTRRFGLVAISTSFTADEGQVRWRAGGAKRLEPRQAGI